MGRIATAWIKEHPGFLVLLAALVVGQVLAKLAQPHFSDSPLAGPVPLVPAVTLGVSVVLAIVIVWLRARLGQQLVDSARARDLSLPRPASLPKRYEVLDAPRQVTSAGLGLVDLALLLLIQATFRGAILALADEFLVPRGRAEAVFVAVVVLIAVLLLIRLWQTGGPVLVLLLWWGIDRLVPTAGFLAEQPAPVATRTTSVSRPVTPAPPALTAPVAEATVRSKSTEAEATLVAPGAQPAEATVLAEATVVSHRPEHADEATVLRPDAQ